jgi:NDP-sugar pyrophosphorylase family protein/flavin reductase (DIM6/NTAB) family NADH-FMN oxidoreductase RutF
MTESGMHTDEPGAMPPPGTRAVVLAGGRGTRLAPFTSILPKPLMPVGERAILELVVEQLEACGITDITFCVGYLSHLIRAVFDSRENGHVHIRYVQEQDALGTSGPLRLVDGLDDTFIVMNGDVLTNIDYADLLAYHRESGNVLTIATHSRSIKIDYGVLHLDGQPSPGIKAYEEKPEVLSTVSMGIYVLEPSVLEYIPKGRIFDLPDLVHALLRDGHRLGAYLYDGLWFDIGRKEDYEQAVAAWIDHGGDQTAAPEARMSRNGNGNRAEALPTAAEHEHAHGDGHIAYGNGHPANGPAHDDGALERQLSVAAAVAAGRVDSQNGETERPRGLSPEDLREALSPVPTAVTIVTTMLDRRPHATTVSSFSSLSSDPPLIMIALDRSSDLLGMLKPGGRFAVNLLSAGQQEVGHRCALKGLDKLATVPWSEVDGLPRIEGAVGWLTCDVHELFPGGDHVIVVGLVTGCESADQASALIYHRRRFLDFVS